MKRMIAMLVVLLTLGGSAVAIGAQTSRAILFLGTSTTEGMGAIPKAARFVDLVKAARPGDTFTELARGGTTLVNADPAKSWENTVIPGGHDIVIAQFGLNEWNTGVTATMLRTQATDFLARVRTANPNAQIYWLSPWIPQYTVTTFPDLRGNLWQEQGMAIEAALRTVQGVHIDLGPTGSRREAAPYSFGGSDGLHYNNAGHRKIADAVLARI